MNEFLFLFSKNIEVNYRSLLLKLVQETTLKTKKQNKEFSVITKDDKLIISPLGSKNISTVTFETIQSYINGKDTFQNSYIPVIVEYFYKDRPKVWIEKTNVKNRKDRLEGDYKLGMKLWSPRRSKDNKDIYSLMREVKPNDIVLHITDNEALSGISLVESKYKEENILLKTEWDGPGYIVELKNFLPLEPSIKKENILSNKNKEILLSLKDQGVFYSKKLEPNQGAYLTNCPFLLLNLINNLYKDLTNENLPYVEEILKEMSDMKPEIINENIINKISFPLNQILFGPPGTGKTYNTIDKAIEIIEQRFVNDEEREDLVKSFNKYKENGQIVFTTFHQSYGYEEFIEGLRSDDSGKFVPTNGIFKDLCEKAKLKKNQKSNFDFDEKTNNVFKMSLGNSTNKEDDIIFDYCVENSVISLGKGGDIDYSSCKTRNEIESQYKNSYPNEINQDVSSMENFKLKLKTNDLVLISLGNKKIRAIARVTGDYFYESQSEIGYKHFRDVEWIYTDVDIQTNDLFVNYKLMQKTLYPVDIDKLNLTKFKTLISKPSDEESQKYVIIIDEINRGNMSKIFGELITLIEDDKREGAENELSVILPYSKDRFSIPSNVYILGTMNTADRSIALLDTALRRRFTFIEMMPQTDLLQENVISGIDLSEFLTVINDRIEYLFDREHTIGHAYFINCNTFEELQQAMKNKVIPLLQEYFYDEWEKIELVLGGCGDENTKDNFFIYKKELKKDIFNKNSKLSDFTEENKAKYFVSPNPSKNAFLNLIGNENEGN